MAMWPFSSVASGLCAFVLGWVAVVYVWFQPDGDGLTMSLSDYAGRAATFGLFYAVSGAVCGLLVALVLTFLVGDARDRRAQRAARLVGGTTYAIAAVVFGAFVGGGAGYFLLLVVTSVVVGLVAGWWHGRLASRPRVEDFYAH
jgi:hypothetical protein